VKRLRRLGALIVGTVLLSGCTLVPTAQSPVVIARSDVGFGLLGKTIPQTINGRVEFITQPVYIVDATGHLTPSSRIVPSPPTLDSVLRELVLGPTDIELFTGYTSALPKKLVILQATIKDGVGFVALSSSLAELSRSQEILAIGQLVFTARAVGATSGLEISVAGVAQPLLMPSGASAKHVTVRNYQSLLNL